SIAWNADTPVFQLEIGGLNTAATYDINVTSSRSNANGAAGPYSTSFHLEDNIGITEQVITDTYQAGNGNTHLGVTFSGVVPDALGTFRLALNFGGTANVAHINALSIIEL